MLPRIIRYSVGIASRRSSIAVVARSSSSPSIRLYSNIRDSKGGFSNREAAEEDRWSHEHDKELIKHLRENLAKHEQEAAKSTSPPPPKREPLEETQLEEVDHIQPNNLGFSGGSIRSAGGGIASREAAVEEKFFHDHDRELVEKLHQKQVEKEDK